MRMYKAVISLVAIVAIATAISARADEGELNPAPPKGVAPSEIISRFAAKEKIFKQERENYIYTQTVRVQEVDSGGEFAQTVDVTFDEHGKRVENVTYAPQSTLQRVSMSREDFQDIQNVMPFVLTTDEINDYQINYVGQ